MDEGYICLSCGHRFTARKPIMEHSTYVRCSKCRSYMTVSEREYLTCKQRAKARMATTVFGIIPLWDIVTETFLERGITLYPRKTIRLCAVLYQDIIKEEIQR